MSLQQQVPSLYSAHTRPSSDHLSETVYDSGLAMRLHSNHSVPHTSHSAYADSSSPAANRNTGSVNFHCSTTVPTRNHDYDQQLLWSQPDSIPQTSLKRQDYHYGLDQQTLLYRSEDRGGRSNGTASTSKDWQTAPGCSSAAGGWAQSAHDNTGSSGNITGLLPLLYANSILSSYPSRGVGYYGTDSYNRK